MDKIKFTLENQKHENYDYNPVIILINGKNLIEILKEYEIPIAEREGSKDIAGNYSGHSPESLYEKLVNNQEEFDEYDGKISVLECTCGFEGCWPFLLQIKEEDTKIIWTDFEQPNRNKDNGPFKWDYSMLNNFEFDKNEYYQELNKLKELITNS